MRTILFLFMSLSLYLFSACANSNTSSSSATVQEKDSISTSLDSIVEMLQMQNATIVDVRKLSQYEEGHIPNSIHIPLDSVISSLDQLKQYENIVLVCNTGNAAGKAQKILNDNGFKNVYNGRGWADLDKLLK